MLFTRQYDTLSFAGNQLLAFYLSSYLKDFHFSEHPHVGRKYRCHLHINGSKFLIITEEDCLHIKERGAIQE